MTVATEGLTLRLQRVAAGAGYRISVRCEPGRLYQAACGDPDRALDVIAGLAPGPGRVTLGARELSGLAPHLRARAGLGTVFSRLPPVPLTVIEVIALPWPPAVALQPWHALLGRSGEQQATADAHAAARALAGRLGLAAWADCPAVDLPAPVSALADVARALAGDPTALIWRAPEWLGADRLASVRELLEAEVHRTGIAALEVCNLMGMDR